jgi:FKBP-type peptidyl-prolyl cis-trans isomerase 2
VVQVCDATMFNSCTNAKDKKIFITKKHFMQQVKSGDTVRVHYHGKLTNGTTFDSSEGREPLEFEVGSGMVIAGFDNGVTGMAVGDKKTVEIPVDEAYGAKQDDLIMEFPKSNFPADMVPEVGMSLNMSNGSGQNFPVVIKEVKDDVVLLDANHPLSGEDLVFDLELVEIVAPKSSIIMP